MSGKCNALSMVTGGSSSSCLPLIGEFLLNVLLRIGDASVQRGT